ncbi:Mannosyl-oligosaccharide glucosidase [Fasciola gigantica]|uniref:Mannosyl-oligosaccharide glucosidase n=1 Tax=Fasciola gigantica TaxID=46835 RepID=A0A504YSB4_FASGI|nr:Mannosyl-oligosaccharide glucosidase [Fasciola gigantica]
MPKSKVIDVRPKKRKTLHRLEQSSTVVSNENPKKIVTHNGNHLVDKFRFSKAKNRGHGDKHFSSELHFGKSQWLIYFGIVMCAVLAVVLVSTGVHRWFSWRQAQSIKTPLNLPLVIAEDTSPADLFWGTYRPGFYFGLKHRSPQPLIFGLIWTVQDIRNPRFRHVCDSHDGVLRQYPTIQFYSYNWIEHDGRNFGTQQIVDQKHIITVSFVKQSAYVANGDWTVRISAVSINRTDPPQPLSVIVYLYYSSASGSPTFAPVVESEKVTGLKGK